MQAAPGLQGSHTGTCVSCLTPTDTALGTRGDPELAAAILHVLGVPLDEAIDLAGRMPADGGTAIRACEACARRAGLPVALITHGAPIPTIRQT